MKKLLLAVSFVMLMAAPAFADNKADVEKAVEGMRLAMLSGKAADLEKIPTPDLIYVHSAGNAENTQQFLDSIVSGKDSYKRVEFNYQTVSAFDTSAIVSHIFDGTIVTKGQNNEQPYDVHLGVVQIWKKVDGVWKLSARKSLRIPF
jgi:hypothetical protein